MNLATKPNLVHSSPQDLRIHARDETPLSREEVLIGLRMGHIAAGPVARSRGFAEFAVVERRRLVEIVNFEEIA